MLIKRKNTGYFDGSFGLPSGHLEPGEKPTECAVREVKEEVGVDIKNPEFVCMIFNTVGDQPHYANFFFKVSSWEGEVKNMEPEKCDELIWKSWDGLPENLTPETRKALENYQSGDFYSEI